MSKLNETDEFVNPLNNMIKEREMFVPTYYSNIQSTSLTDSPVSFGSSSGNVNHTYLGTNNITSEKDAEHNKGF